MISDIVWQCRKLPNGDSEHILKPCARHVITGLRDDTDYSDLLARAQAKGDVFRLRQLRVLWHVHSTREPWYEITDIDPETNEITDYWVRGEPPAWRLTPYSRIGAIYPKGMGHEKMIPATDKGKKPRAESSENEAGNDQKVPEKRGLCRREQTYGASDNTNGKGSDLPPPYQERA